MEIQLINIIEPPNGLNFKEQSIIVKRIFYQYGGDLDLTKSRVKCICIDGNTIGMGLVDRLLEDVIDNETEKPLGCFGTINTDDKPSSFDAPNIIYVLKAQGINGDIIRHFIDYVETNKLKLIKNYEDIENDLSKDIDKILVKVVTVQTQFLLDEVANLKLKKTQTSITVEQVIKRIDKDRYSALAYSIYYIAMFLDKEHEEEVDLFDALAPFIGFY